MIKGYKNVLTILEEGFLGSVNLIVKYKSVQINNWYLLVCGSSSIDN